MAREDHTYLLRRYLEARHIEGAQAMDALAEMQAWGAENMRAEYARVRSIAMLYVRTTQKAREKAEPGDVVQ